MPRVGRLGPLRRRGERRRDLPAAGPQAGLALGDRDPAPATVFTVAGRRTAGVAGALLGDGPKQVVGGDRFSAYGRMAARWRQIAWAHLRRDFQAMVDRGGGGKPTGEALLGRSRRPFHDWHRARDGTLDWGTFVKRMTRPRREVRRALKGGSARDGARTSGTRREILKVEEGLWTFARVKGVGPTNNAAERASRSAVIWRKISGGTDSGRGSRFVERALSVVTT